MFLAHVVVYACYSPFEMRPSAFYPIRSHTEKFPVRGYDHCPIESSAVVYRHLMVGFFQFPILPSVSKNRTPFSNMFPYLRKQCIGLCVLNGPRYNITASLIHTEHRHLVLETPALTGFNFFVLMAVSVLSTDKGLDYLNFG